MNGTWATRQSKSKTTSCFLADMVVRGRSKCCRRAGLSVILFNTCFVSGKALPKRCSRRRRAQDLAGNSTVSFGIRKSEGRGDPCVRSLERPVAWKRCGFKHWGRSLCLASVLQVPAHLLHQRPSTFARPLCALDKTVQEVCQRPLPHFLASDPVSVQFPFPHLFHHGAFPLLQTGVRCPRGAAVADRRLLGTQAMVQAALTSVPGYLQNFRVSLSTRSSSRDSRSCLSAVELRS